MRYSIAFLGLIATTTAGNSDPSCHRGIQPILVPLAKEPAASKYCAAKYPAIQSLPQLVKQDNEALLEPRMAPTPTPIPKPQNPLYAQFTNAASDIASTFCSCNFPTQTSTPGGRGGRGGRKYRGRVRRYDNGVLE